MYVNTLYRKIWQCLIEYKRFSENQINLYLIFFIFRPTFENFWRDFVNKQEIDIEDLYQRDDFYRQFSHAGWAGASGTDCIGIA